MQPTAQAVGNHAPQNLAPQGAKEKSGNPKPESSAHFARNEKVPLPSARQLQNSSVPTASHSALNHEMTQ